MRYKFSAPSDLEAQVLQVRGQRQRLGTPISGCPSLWISELDEGEAKVLEDLGLVLVPLEHQ